MFAALPAMGYLAGRVAQGLLVVLGVSLIVFALSYLGGDPAAALLPQGTDPADVEAFRRAAGFDQPLPVQYARFLSRALTGDFGESLRYREPAMPLVLARLPLTFALAGLGLGVALALALPLGIAAAAWPGRWPDRLAQAAFVLAQATPNFWFATLAILVFAVALRWLPPSGIDDARGLVLPALTIALLPAATTGRLLRSRLREVLAQDYIRTAHAKGLPPARVLREHALRNAALPVVTVLALQLGNLLGGALIAEAVFALPGLGRLALQSISARDVPLIQAFVFVSASFVVAVNMALDVVYVWIDPRVRRP
ncbi:MAG: ABC transporter permease [Chloroflexi bacterium]|nr:ABC transporter permease [Chloroflexota bacterium]